MSKNINPYLFVSYSHKDSARVIPIINELQQNGFRVWYDAGIEAGTEWPEEIAEHLMNSRSVLIFLSKNAVESKNCRREINFAIDKEKNILVVYLEEFELSLGMQMQLNTLQALFMFRQKNNNDFMEQLIKSDILQACLDESEKIEKKLLIDNSMFGLAVAYFKNFVLPFTKRLIEFKTYNGYQLANLKIYIPNYDSTLNDKIELYYQKIPVEYEREGVEGFRVFVEKTEHKEELTCIDVPSMINSVFETVNAILSDSLSDQDIEVAKKHALDVYYNNITMLVSHSSIKEFISVLRY